MIRVLAFLAGILFFLGFLVFLTFPIMNQLHQNFFFDINNLAVLGFVFISFILGIAILWLSADKEE